MQMTWFYMQKTLIIKKTELRSKFSKVAGYKLNIQNQFSYIDNEQSEQKLGKQFHLQYNKKKKIFRN